MNVDAEQSSIAAAEDGKARLLRVGGRLTVTVGPRVAAAAVAEAERYELDGPSAGLRHLAQRQVNEGASLDAMKLKMMIDEARAELAKLRMTTSTTAITATAIVVDKMLDTVGRKLVG